MGDSNARNDSVAAAKSMPEASIGEEIIYCLQGAPRLTGLDIVDGAELGNMAGAYWTTQDLVRLATVRATTAPPNSPGIAWGGDHAGLGQTQRTIVRTATGTFSVRATLNNPERAVHLNVLALTALTCDLRIQLGPGHYKDYAGFVGGFQLATLTATAAPADLRAWSRLVWNIGQPGLTDNVREVTVAAVGDQTVTVTLGTPATGQHIQQALLHICQWPALEVSELTFSGGHTINCDTAYDFDRRWTRARIAEVLPDRFNPPQCYTRGTAITLSARLRVTRAPTDTEWVNVRGRANIGGVAMEWAAAPIAVAPNAVTVDFAAAVTAPQTLAPVVGHYPGAQINWEMQDPNNAWVAMGQTTHTLYVTMGDPVAPLAVYWTLLHASCVNGAGCQAAGALADAAFTSYTGRNMRRKRDNKPMTYWDPRAQARPNGTTARMLASDTTRQQVAAADNVLPWAGGEAVATGHCGAWAESFIDMLGIHGVATAQKINVQNMLQMLPPPAVPPAAPGGFLVATWTFMPPAVPNGAALTHHHWITCVAGAYAPGQSNPTPPPAFGNHFVVWCTSNSTLYDPSYGTHFTAATTNATLLAWEMASISGLSRGDNVNPNAGYATTAVPAPGRRLRFRRTVSGIDL